MDRRGPAGACCGPPVRDDALDPGPPPPPPWWYWKGSFPDAFRAYTSCAALSRGRPSQLGSSIGLYRYDSIDATDSDGLAGPLLRWSAKGRWNASGWAKLTASAFGP